MTGFKGPDYGLGDVDDVIALLDRAMLKCEHGDVTEARKMINAARDHVANTDDLIRRPAVWNRLGEVLTEVINRENGSKAT